MKTSTGYTLTSRTTGQVSTFNADGQLVTVADRNGNKASYAYTNGVVSKVTGYSGPAGARTATITTSPTQVKVSQTSGTETRAVVFEKDATNNITGFVDAKGARTVFESVGGQVRSITSPGGYRTEFAYDDQDRLTALTRAAGVGQAAVTRLSYASDTQTLVAGANTNQSLAVSAVPRSTFTLDATDRVTKATDPLGRAQGASYTADFDVASATSGSGTSAGTTTNTFGANSGQSLTKTSSPTGAASALEYGNTASATKYLPTAGTDASGNKSTYTYNGTGNMLSSTQAGGVAAAVAYNADGTVATATAPGNGGNSTKYSYDANKQLTQITPVTGTTLGAQALTYDVWGRTASVTDGRGHKITYTYDRMGRVLKESYSDGTPAVSYTYDADGHQVKRVDGSGTTTMGFDGLGRLTKRGHSAAGEEVTYGYDKASNLTSVTDKRGRTSYDFDASGTPTTIWYETGGVKKRADIATDNRGRRTDIWMETPGGDHSVWAAHQHTDYDKSGRISRSVAKVGNGNTTNTTVQDKTYCYTAGTTPAGGCTASAASDRGKIQWVKDAVDASATVFTYDTKGQVIKAVRTGGADPRTYTYTYDERGNRLSSAKTEGYAATALTFNAANQITNSTYAYDASGNMTKDIGGTFTYNAAGQMTSHTRPQGTFTYTYAGGSQSELIKQTTTRGNYTYGYGRPNQFGLPVVEQVTLDGKTAHLDNDPVTGQPLMLRTAEGVQSLYVYDGIGNPEALVTNQDSTTFAYDYDPYGVPALNDDNGEGDPVNPFQFKGGIHDRSTNWVKFGYRWYSVGTGRFTQRDTLDAPLDPANANRYTFAGNDPINYSDPLGLAVGCDEIGLVVGVGVGLALIPVTAGASALVTAGATIGSGVAGYGASKACQAPDNGGTPPPTKDQLGYEVNPSNGSRF